MLFSITHCNVRRYLLVLTNSEGISSCTCVWRCTFLSFFVKEVHNTTTTLCRQNGVAVFVCFLLKSIPIKQCNKILNKERNRIENENVFCLALCSDYDGTSFGGGCVCECREKNTASPSRCSAGDAGCTASPEASGI